MTGVLHQKLAITRYGLCDIAVENGEALTPTQRQLTDGVMYAMIIPHERFTPHSRLVVCRSAFFGQATSPLTSSSSFRRSRRRYDSMSSKRVFCVMATLLVLALTLVLGSPSYGRFADSAEVERRAAA